MHRGILKISLLNIAIILLFIAPVFSSVIDEETKKNLKSEWLVYDQKHDIYVPFIENTGQLANSFAFFVKKNEAKGQQLHCCVQAGTSFFIEEKIMAVYDANECFNLNIDSLFAVFKKDNLYISVYNESLRFKEFSTYLISPIITDQATSKNIENDLIERKKGGVKNFYIIALLLFTSLLGIAYNTNPKLFKEYYALNKTFTFVLRSDNAGKLSLFDRFTLFILFLHSSFIAFVLVVVFQQQHEVFANLVPVKYDGLAMVMYGWLKLSALVFFALILKFLLIRVISKLMRFTEMVSTHFFEFLRLSIFIYSATLIFVLVIMFYSYTPVASDFNWVIYLIAGLSVLRVIFLYIKFLRLVTFKNLYLFLYLCATEIFPLLMGFKIFIWN